MRIIIDIPEWAQERHLFIMAGIEMLAYKLYGEDVIHVKTERCRMCGGCCPGEDRCLEPVGADGNCIYLEDPKGEVRECSLAIKRPFVCSTGLHQKGRTPGCSIEYLVKPIK